MVPVEVSKVRPVGSDGEIDQFTTVPPPTDGVAEVMVVPFVNVNGLPLYVTPVGGASLTTMVTVVVALPPVLLAVTV